MPAKVQHRQAKNESSIGFIFSPQVENLQAYKFEHLYQQRAGIKIEPG